MQRFGQRRPLRIRECIVQDFERCVQLLLVFKRRECVVQGKIVFALLGFFLQHRIAYGGLPRRVERRLQRNRGIDINSVKMRQVSLIQKSEAFIHICISIQINITVARMIVSAVEIQIVLIGQLRNYVRISAGFHAVRGVRQKGLVDFAHQHIVR